MNILLAGESWHELTLYAKGTTVTTTAGYTEAGEHLIAALETAGATVTYQPNHIAHREFPRTAEALDEYDLVVLSDIGAQTLLVSPSVAAGETDGNRCQLLSEFVANGGALGMIGGYTSFAGELGQAGYGRTALAEVLPVDIGLVDDRVERPTGVTPKNIGLPELPAEWPAVLGYNRLEPEGKVLATVDEDPLLVVGDYGEGRTFAFTTDCAPHWAPAEFLEWGRLPALWAAVLDLMDPNR